MEYLESTEVGDNIPEGKNTAENIESLRKAVRALHENKLVFGDLRGPNILLTEGGLKLVDFDWCGEEGVVYYPANISMDIGWPKGVGGGEKIRSAHDREWFRMLTGTEL